MLSAWTLMWTFTHKYITTGLEENKFGINPYEFDAVMDAMSKLKTLKFMGLHLSSVPRLLIFGISVQEPTKSIKWLATKGLSSI